MNADEEAEAQDARPDHSQREYFDDGRSNSAATRPPVGGPQTDPALPGVPSPGSEDLYDGANPAAEADAPAED
jgi:hypothetical protein